MKRKLFSVGMAIIFVNFAACRINEPMSRKSASVSMMWSESDRTKASKRLARMDIPITDVSLFSAIEKAETRIVEDLLKAGINANTMGYDKNLPIHRAVGMRQMKIAKLLINAGADVNSTNWLSLTPLIFAASNNADPSAVRMLLLAGALVDKCSDDGMTPLMYAAGGPVADRLSFERGLPDRRREPEAFRKLQTARGRHLQVVKLLLQHGASFAATDKSGMTALDHAEENKQTAIAEFLFQKGAKRGQRVAN